MRLPFLLSFCLLFLLTPMAYAATPTVKVVFFSSPDCPFCALVAEGDLQPLQQQYGSDLRILTVDTTTEMGGRALRQMWVDFDVPSARRGVPTLLVDDRVLVGAHEIPNELPGLIEDHREKGGVAWPDIEGLEKLLEVESSVEFYEATDDNWRTRFARDVPGNYVSTTLLVILILIALAMMPRRPWQKRLSKRAPFGLKVGVATLGFVVALYLAYGETTRQDLFCGPLGQCNIVQHSDMAMLFGVLPLAILGALAYGTLLGLYFFRRFHSSKWTRLTPTLVLGLTVFGFAFSVLLTFWQPFMIGATCSWCLISAVTMTTCCLLNLGEGREQVAILRRDGLGALLGGPPRSQQGG